MQSIRATDRERGGVGGENNVGQVEQHPEIEDQKQSRLITDI